MEKQVSANKQAAKPQRRMVYTAMLFAVAIVLSIIEGLLPPLPIPVPGIKFGLSNIAVMFSLFFLDKQRAYTIAVLKSVFVLITRGAIAGLLSLTGGILSLTVMMLAMWSFKEKLSYLVISIIGAVFHNAGQFIAIAFIYSDILIWTYLPVLLISGVVAGAVTATLLKLSLPTLKRLVN